MSATVLISLKDLRERVRDRSAVMLAVVLPLALAFLFNLVLGSSAVPRPFSFAVADLDHGHVGEAFSGVLTELSADGVVVVRVAGSAAEAAALAEQGTVDAAFVVPPGFTETAFSGAAGGITVIGNVNSPTGSEVARSLAQSFVTSLNSVRISVAASVDGHPPTPVEAARLGEQAAQAARVLALVNVSAATKLLDSKTYFAAGMAVFFLFFTVQFGVSSLLDERNYGTLHRLLAAPIRRQAILGGKLLTSFLLGCASMTVLVLATTFLMGARWGNPAGVALLIGAAVLAATAVTGVVASLARTPEQAGSWQAFVSVLFGLLGGAFFPIAQIGGFASIATLATPHAWFLRGLGDLSGDAGVSSVLPAVAALLLFAAVCGSVAFLRLNRVVAR